jgi:D-glycero-alpha-D-manno-heptose-7-phosphate kinase
VLDAGGWTDTWFARDGAVCHLAVDGGTEVAVVRSGTTSATDVQAVHLDVSAFGDRYRVALDVLPGRHPLLEAALRRWAPRDCDLHVTVASAAPPGSGLGTSASVVVALVAALQAIEGATLEPAALTRAAHEIETIDVGLEAGVQDQVAAAYGGSNLITMERYPDAVVQPLDVPPATWDALCHRLVTVYLGEPHRSSAIHDTVIAHLASADGTRLLAPLRAAARDAATALIGGDLDAYGRAMIANTEAQAALHPQLVDPLAREVIEVARRFGALGWKVNGAGGSVTIIGPEDPGGLTGALASFAALTTLSLLPARQGARVIDEA